MLVGVAPEDPEVTGVGGPTVSAGLFPPDVDEEGDLTLPCNQPNQRALLSTQSPPPNHHQTPRCRECLPVVKGHVTLKRVKCQSPSRVARKSYLIEQQLT